MSQQRQLAAPAYLVAFALIAIPPFDVLMQVMPMQVHNPRWRYGVFGLFSNAFMIPMVGLLLAFVATAWFEHRRFQKVLGVLSLIVALATAVCFGLFALDTLQIRQGVRPAAELAFKVATSTAVLKSLLGLVTLGAFSFAAFRAPRAPRPATSHQRSGSLLIGAKPTPPLAANRPGIAVPKAPATEAGGAQE